MNRFRLLLLLAALAGSLVAAPLERELGSGLAYVRVHHLPEDLPGKSASHGAAVIDVRYVDADADAASAFAAWLRFRASTRAPVFLLANPDTSRALLRALEERDRGAVVLIGSQRARFHPDIAVSTSAEEERRAYDALEKGAAVLSLLTDNPNKVRNDEASLSKDRLAEASADATEAAATGKVSATPPIDAALQRAVHLHRALLALKRL